MNKVRLLWILWKRLSNHLNVKGLPFPMIRDPKTGQGSVTVTLVVASAGACFISIGLMLSVFIAKWNQWFVFTDDTFESLKVAFEHSFEVLLASLAAYLGRKWQSGKGGAIDNSSSPDVSLDSVNKTE